MAVACAPSTSSLRTSNGYNAKWRKVYEPVEAALPAPSTHNEEWRCNRSKVFGAFGGFWLTGALRAYISHGGRKSNQEQQRLRPCLFSEGSLVRKKKWNKKLGTTCSLDIENELGTNAMFAREREEVGWGAATVKMCPLPQLPFNFRVGPMSIPIPPRITVKPWSVHSFTASGVNHGSPGQPG